MRNVTRPMRFLIGVVLVVAVLGWTVGAMAGEKRGGTLTIVRPTDPVT